MSNNSYSKTFLDWIHCNRCYESYMKKSRPFLLLAGCYHVTCVQCTPEVKCTENGPSYYKCPLCLKAVRGCLLSNAMPNHLKELFHPEPYKDGLNTCQIMQFQQRHRQRFLDYIHRVHRTDKELKENIYKYRGLARNAYHDLYQAKIERKHLEKRVLIVKKQQRDIEEKRLSTNRPGFPVFTTETISRTSHTSVYQFPPNKSMTHSINELCAITSITSQQRAHSIPSVLNKNNGIVSFIHPSKTTFTL